MADEWDEPLVEQVSQMPQGRVFGMRGRGFKPTEHPRPGKVAYSQNAEPGLNGTNRVKDYDRNGRSNSFKNNNYSDYNMVSKPKTKEGFKDKWNGHSDGGRSKIQGGVQMPEKPKRQVYIPEEIFPNEESLFSGGISSGINFSKYDEIEVRVSGENIPKKISHFEEAGLFPLLLSNIEKCNYKKPTPIQKFALPIVMNGRDVMACAQTGSGKTASFLLPIIHGLLESSPLPIGSDGTATPQFMVVTPTRELAIQIYVEARKFTFGSDLKTEIVYGGTNVRYQKDKVKCGCNILIGTPGRLNDFINRQVVSLSEVRYLVFDEADRLLDMKFLPQIETVLNSNALNKENVQILMFSATFPDSVQRLAVKYLKNYLFLAVGIVGGACTDVEQKFHCVSKFDKRPKLIELLQEKGSCKTLVFVDKKRTADIIAAFLSEKDFPATSMHGDREQPLREEALNDFKSGKMDVLVATSVASRGLDIKNVAHVINFDLPHSVDEYVHRIGRTGRVGNRGLATSFYDPDVDSAIAPDLVKVLTQVQQEVPDFLLEAGSYSPKKQNFSDFGGKDIRRGGAQMKQNTLVLETVPTYENEVW